MKLLLDENVSPTIAERLNALGIPTRSVSHIGLTGRSDRELFAIALECDEVLVTVNSKDFLKLAAACEVHPGVILIREGELTADEQYERVRAALARVEGRDELINTVVEVLSAAKVSVRPIPP